MSISPKLTRILRDADGNTKKFLAERNGFREGGCNVFFHTFLNSVGAIDIETRRKFHYYFLCLFTFLLGNCILFVSIGSIIIISLFGISNWCFSSSRIFEMVSGEADKMSSMKPRTQKCCKSNETKHCKLHGLFLSYDQNFMIEIGNHRM